MLFAHLNPQNPFERKCRWYIYLLWTVTGAISAAVLTIIFNILSIVENPSYQEAAEGLFSASPHLSVMFLLYCIITPTVEEFIFRYLVYGFINKKTSRPVLSIVAASALFGLYHLNPVQILYGFLMGLVITLGYSRERNIIVPILIHSAANLVALVFTFYPFTA